MFSSKTSPSEKPPSKQGYLFKRGNNKGPKQMKQRWFALEANTLSYYKNNKLNSAPLGFISLSQVESITARKDAEEGAFEIKMQNDGDKEGRIYYLRARSNVEADEWVVVVNESRKYYERGGLPSTESQEGALRLELQQKGREIEALARSLQLTKDLLDKEKKRANLILETERAEANKIREAQKGLSVEVSSLKAQLAEKEKQLSTYKELVETSDTKEVEIQNKIALAKKPEEDLKEELECRTEELKEMKEKLKEKKAKIRDMRKQLATANEVFSLTASRMGNMSLTESQQDKARSFTNMSDSDSVFLMKEKMAEMKEAMEKRMEELQEKLDAQIAENHKLDSDAAQWKSMAQKELKTRLNLESERASLQRQLSESRESTRYQSQSSSRSKSSREESTEYATLPPEYEKDSKPKSGYQPLEEEGADGYYTKKGGGGNPKSSGDCLTCSIQ